jgi:hypothetical protein
VNKVMKVLNSEPLECVKDCEFLCKLDHGDHCDYHKTMLVTVDDKVIRCRQCERHEHYKILTDHVNKVIDKYNFFVKDMDEKIDRLCYLVDRVNEKI